jgi:hypothetical protein
MGILIAILLVAFMYGIIGCGVVLFIVAVLKQKETFENVDMPMNFEWAIITWPYRVVLCFAALAEQSETEESKDLKKNPLD